MVYELNINPPNSCPLGTFGASQVVLVVKNPSASGGDIGDSGWMPGLGRPPGGGHGNPLQYSCLENSTDRGNWWAAVHGVTKSQTWLKWLSTHTRTHARDPMNVTLFGNRVFADVTSMRWSWMRVGPKFNDWHTHREDSHVNKGRDLEPCTYKPETPKSSENHQKLRRGKEGLCPRNFRESLVLLTPWIQTSSFQNSEKVYLCCFKISSLW